MSDAVTDEAPESPKLLDGERIALTGTLASMTHREAAQLIEDHGGAVAQHISQSTTMLVIGEEGWPLEPDGHPSCKLLQAQSLRDRGQEIRLVSESEWLTALGLEAWSKTQRLYTPAVLSQMLGVTVHDVRRWERLGLIQARQRVMRLPYFDFREVSAASRLANLLASGVNLDVVARSLERLQAVLPDLDQPLAQLQMLAQGQQVLYRDRRGWVESSSGQRRLPFDEETQQPPASTETSDTEHCDVVAFRSPAPDPTASWNDGQWFQHGCQLAEANQLLPAIKAFRMALVENPSAAEYHFHLADALYRHGRPHAAIERYYVAVEQDHDFIEAWTQLGCLLVETGDVEEAAEAFQVALDRHPEFPDAHFFLARLLQQRGDLASAESHWQTYLSLDSHGPWADVARQQLTQIADALSGSAVE